MTLDTAVIACGRVAFSGDALREFEEVGRARFFDVL
jgi:hypothetical protein